VRKTDPLRKPEGAPGLARAPIFPGTGLLEPAGCAAITWSEESNETKSDCYIPMRVVSFPLTAFAGVEIETLLLR
jgi:hypothetical protein